MLPLLAVWIFQTTAHAFAFQFQGFASQRSVTRIKHWGKLCLSGVRDALSAVISAHSHWSDRDEKQCFILNKTGSALISVLEQQINSQLIPIFAFSCIQIRHKLLYQYRALPVLDHQSGSSTERREKHLCVYSKPQTHFPCFTLTASVSERRNYCWSWPVNILQGTFTDAQPSFPENYSHSRPWCRLRFMSSQRSVCPVQNTGWRGGCGGQERSLTAGFNLLFIDYNNIYLPNINH